MGLYLSRLLIKHGLFMTHGTNPGGGGPSDLNDAGRALSCQCSVQGGGQVQTSRSIKSELKLSGGLHVSDGEQPSDPPSKSPSENTTDGYKDYDNEYYRGIVLCRCCSTRVPRERPSFQPCGCTTVCQECAFEIYAGDKICPACGIKMSSDPKMVGRFQS